MNRRKFIHNSVGASLLSLAPAWAGARTQNQTYMPDTLKPARLKEGAVIGLVAPGYLIGEEPLNDVKKYLAELGYVPYHTDTILKKHGYFAGTDEERVADFNAMFMNEAVDAVFCARGGYGCTRILNRVDFEAIRTHPKILLGFSDVTALLNAIYQKTGLVTFHGPVGTTLNDPYTIDALKSVLENPRRNHLIQSEAEDSQKIAESPEYERYLIHPGKAEGRLAGGNLSLMAAMSGTPYQINCENAIVCIEDVDEEPYRVDRMLTQLIESGQLGKAAGIALGVFSGCHTSKNKNSFSLKEVILDRVKPLSLPAVYGLSFGHIKHNFTFPIGLEAVLDAGEMTLRLKGKAVR